MGDFNFFELGKIKILDFNYILPSFENLSEIFTIRRRILPAFRKYILLIQKNLLFQRYWYCQSKRMCQERNPQTLNAKCFRKSSKWSLIWCYNQFDLTFLVPNLEKASSMKLESRPLNITQNCYLVAQFRGNI